MIAHMTNVTQPAKGGRGEQVRRFRLRVSSGAQKGKDIQASGERLVIGTHRSADLVLADNTMSRFHCEIVIEDGRALLRDLGSLNGTVVDGVSVLAAHLSDRAQITVGETQLVFELGDDHVE